jgi:hypothetical protein
VQIRRCLQPPFLLRGKGSGKQHHGHSAGW